MEKAINLKYLILTLIFYNCSYLEDKRDNNEIEKKKDFSVEIFCLPRFTNEINHESFSFINYPYIKSSDKVKNNEWYNSTESKDSIYYNFYYKITEENDSLITYLNYKYTDSVPRSHLDLRMTCIIRAFNRIDTIGFNSNYVLFYKNKFLIIDKDKNPLFISIINRLPAELKENWMTKNWRDYKSEELKVIIGDN